jgi:glycosyltransferase involved in cell wall biosynthesis
MKLLAVVIPVFNEARLLRPCLDRLVATPPPTGCKRIIVLVDDGSTDGSREQVAALSSNPAYLVDLHERNRGKGASVRTGFARALAVGADLILIHDADLEYDPADHAPACTPILENTADVVIGTRFAKDRPRPSSRVHRAINGFLTRLSNAITGLHVTDMECCTKVFTRDVLRQITIEEDRFGLEPELVAKVARLTLPNAEGTPRPIRVAEVPVSYAGRSHAEGKKIGWKDGISALRCILRYGLR